MNGCWLQRDEAERDPAHQEHAGGTPGSCDLGSETLHTVLSLLPISAQMPHSELQTHFDVHVHGGTLKPKYEFIVIYHLALYSFCGTKCFLELLV